MRLKKHIALLVLFVCFIGQAIAQPVMVERSGRSAKSYYSPDTGIFLDFNVGYTLSMGKTSDVADATLNPSFGFNIGYGINKNWKVGIGYQNANFQQDKGYTTIKDDLYAMTGVTVESVNFNSVLANVEYSYPVSQFVRPYISLAVGMSGVQLATDIANSYSFTDSKWMPTIAPQVGLRGYFDKGSTVGYNASVSYNQAFGKVKNINHELSSPSYLRIGLGIFVKFM